MSLLTQMMEEYQYLDPSTENDGMGGVKTTWTPGAKFSAAMAKNMTTEQQIAEKQGITESFTFVVDESITLDYHTVFQRLRDNAVFRVTSRTTDSTAHPASTVRIAKVTAERWVLPA